ncbi:MAG: Structural maintenance of chromosomes protein 4, partial [Paramarteilia canceri]
GDLGSVEKIYDVAVSTASSKLDNIVVESLDTAVQSIEQMKVHSAGTASFIILEKMKPCQNQKPLNSGAGTSANQIFDLIKVSDKKFLPAFKFAFGNTFVADNEEEAERLAFRSKQRQRVVTLKGSLIEVTGAMSGGGNPSRGRMQIYNKDNSLHCDASTTLFDSNVYDSLKIEVENIEKEFESLQSSITKILDAKNSLELSIDELTEKLKINNIKLAENYRTLNEISEKSKIFSKKLQQFEVENSKKISKCEVSLKKLRKDYDSCESRLKDSKSCYESIENQLKAISDRLIDPAEKQLKSVQSQLTQQKQELFLCTPVNNKKKMDKLKSSQKSLIEKISEKCKSLEEIEQKMK